MAHRPGVLRAGGSLARWSPSRWLAWPVSKRIVPLLAALADGPAACAGAPRQLIGHIATRDCGGTGNRQSSLLPSSLAGRDWFERGDEQARLCPLAVLSCSRTVEIPSDERLCRVLAHLAPQHAERCGEAEREPHSVRGGHSQHGSGRRPATASAPAQAGRRRENTNSQCRKILHAVVGDRTGKAMDDRNILAMKGFLPISSNRHGFCFAFLGAFFGIFPRRPWRDPCPWGPTCWPAGSSGCNVFPWFVRNETSVRSVSHVLYLGDQQ